MGNKINYVMPLFVNKWAMIDCLTNELAGELIKSLIEYATAPDEYEANFSNPLLYGYFVAFKADYEAFCRKKEQDRERQKRSRERKNNLVMGFVLPPEEIIQDEGQ